MKKITIILFCSLVFFFSFANGKEKQSKTLSNEVQKSLEAKGFTIHGFAPKIVPPMEDSLKQKKEITRISVSLNLGDSDIKPVRITTPQNKNFSNTNSETIMTEDFEGDFPGNIWQRSGDPTWGKTDYIKHAGSYSAWCAKDSTTGIEPGNNYPDSCQSMIIYGPFDLNDVNYSLLNFWYWLDVEQNKDWFFYFVSIDRENFHGIGLTGSTSWRSENFHLSNVPGFGNATGNSQVWIAFLFESDQNTTTDKGVFIDDINLTKSNISGTPIAHAINGVLKKENSPYIAIDHVGVAEEDSLIIEAGVEIKFNESLKFISIGSLTAVGTDLDSIFFTSHNMNPAPKDWIGIDCYSKSSIKLEYCVVEYAYTGINAFNSTLEATHCRISDNYRGILLEYGDCTISECYITKNNIQGRSDAAGIFCAQSSNAKIYNSIITNNKRTGIDTYLSNPHIEGNTIAFNETGISSGWISSPTIYNNIIYENTKDGIDLGTNVLPYSETNVKVIKNIIKMNGGNGIKLKYNIVKADIMNNIIFNNKGNGISATDNDYKLRIPELIFINNTIYNNTTGIDLGFIYTSSTSLINNIIFNNKIGINSNEPNFIYFGYNNLHGNEKSYEGFFPDSTGIFIFKNNNGNNCDKYHNISVPADFVNPDLQNFRLQFGSPCINSGSESILYNDKDGSVNDMGAYGGTGLATNFLIYEFQKTIIDKSKDVTFKILNNRDTTITVDSYKLIDDHNFSCFSIAPFVIDPFDEKEIIVSFNPKQVGHLQTRYTINSQDFSGAQKAEILFSGTCFQGTYVSGEVTGIWTKENSPYIAKLITVPEVESLIIGPGVELLFDGIARFNIYGSLRILGNEQDSVVISHLYPCKDYFGKDRINFYGSDSISILNYCIIKDLNGREYGTSRNPYLNSYGNVHFFSCDIGRDCIGRISGLNSRIAFDRCNVHSDITATNSDIFLNNCNIRSLSAQKGEVEINKAVIDKGCVMYDKAAIHLYDGCNVKIINSIISNSPHGGGIVMKYCEGYLKNNIIANNHSTIYDYGSSVAGGIMIWNDGIVSLINNIIINNSTDGRGGGIYITNHGNMNIINNTIWNNKANSGGGIYVYSNSENKPNLINNIIYSNIDNFNNENQIVGNVAAKYNDIQYGFEGEGNIDANPIFFDPTNDNFHLQPNSPCIDAGNDSIQYNDPEDPNNPGNALYPALGTIRNDMGAFGGPYAAYYSFNLAPAPFGLIAPINGDTLHTLKPVFSWNKAVDPNPGDQVVYTLKIDDEQSFSSPLIFSNVSDTNYTLTTNLIADSTYYWNVIATDQFGLETTSLETYQFTIGNLAPSSFSLLTPANNDTVFNLDPILIWEESIDPIESDSIYYTLFYGLDSTFNVADTVDNIFKNSHQVSDLNDHVNYFWKIMATNNHGASTISNIFQFFTFAAPMAFELISPIQDDTVTTDNIVFKWHPAFDPNPLGKIDYTLYFDISKLFVQSTAISDISDTTYAFTDSLTNNKNYFWTVVAVDNDSFVTVSPDTFNFWVNDTPSIVSDLNSQALPSEYGLSQNYPNPFNPITTIKYQLPKTSLITINIYNVLGHLIRTLVEEKQEAGYHSIIWDGKDNNKQKVSSGIYLYTLKANNFVKTRKLVFIK